VTAPVTVTTLAGGARVNLRLFHPKGNIVTLEMMRAIGAALETLRANPHLKLITIDGEGPDFSYGASIPEHAPGEIARVLPESHRLILGLLDAPAPTAAIVRGRCLGGGFELALACDFIFAAESASFGLPEVALGVFPPAAAALLPHRAGTARATRAIVTGASQPARAWYDAGLVECVAPDAELETTVDRWFRERLAARSASALRYAARAARTALAAHVRALLPELERIYLEGVMGTRDAREGIAAFLEKRPPEWTDQ
jgi:cyclohexa-1,5-dienecarbonyl-CoA hydratase